MSSYLAIAAVTASIAALVRDAMHDVPGLSNAPDVRIARPQPDPTFVGAHLFLYRVAPNAFLRNEDLPTRNGDGRLVKRPSYAADLEYVLSFYGNDQTFEPQRLLGRVVTALHAEPVLSAERIRTTIANTSVLAGSTLDREVQPIHIVPISLDLEDLSRMWSTFYQTPYNLTLAYAASVVVLDAEAAPMPPPGAVELRGFAVARLPRIDTVEPRRFVSGFDRIVTVRGSGIAGTDALRFAGALVPTAAAGSGALSAVPPPVVGRIPVEVAPQDGAPSLPASLLVAPLIGTPLLTQRSAAGGRTLSVTAAFLPDPRQQYHFVLYELRDDDAPRGGAELDGLVTWLDPAAAGPLAAGPVGAHLAAALNAAVRMAPGDEIAASDAMTADAFGWRITSATQQIALRATGELLAVAWGLAPGGALACDASTVPPGTYAVALRVDDDPAATSTVLRGTQLFALPTEPAPADDAPLSAALSAEFARTGLTFTGAARTRVPLAGSAFVVPSADAAPLAWIDAPGAGVTAYALAQSGPAIAPLVEVPA